jgi:hypothetical protein
MDLHVFTNYSLPLYFRVRKRFVVVSIYFSFCARLDLSLFHIMIALLLCQKAVCCRLDPTFLHIPLSLYFYVTRRVAVVSIQLSFTSRCRFTFMSQDVWLSSRSNFPSHPAVALLSSHKTCGCHLDLLFVLLLNYFLFILWSPCSVISIYFFAAIREHPIFSSTLYHRLSS